MSTIGTTSVLAAADMMHALLVKRAIEISELIVETVESTEEQHELAAITDAIEAYKRVRWPGLKTDGGEPTEITGGSFEHRR